MAYKVLVVDDSTFFRRRVKEILEQDPDLEVIGDARNGRDAVQQVKGLKPDVVTMDVEMPIMDGITAVKQIMAESPVPILMFSSLTHEGATATLDALDAGALDFLPKKFEDIARNRKEAIDLLQSRVKELGRRKASFRFARPAATLPAASPNRLGSSSARFFGGLNRPGEALAPPPMPRNQLISNRPSGKKYKILVIGTSTGGPVALQRILTKLPADFPHPILLVQHMPGTFTSAFAERLNGLCNIKVKEASHGDLLRPGSAYLAPGGRQMLLDGNANNARVVITDSEETQVVTYKPSVDLTFSSVSRVFGADVLGLILTGMGSDGREGSRSLKNGGAKIWAQDEQSCVVYGMPQAVTVENIAEANISLDDIARHILIEMH